MEIEAEYMSAVKKDVSFEEKRRIRNKKYAALARIRQRLEKKYTGAHFTEIIKNHSEKCDKVVDILMDSLKDHPDISDRI